NKDMPPATDPCRFAGQSLRHLILKTGNPALPSVAPDPAPARPPVNSPPFPAIAAAVARGAIAVNAQSLSEYRKQRFLFPARVAGRCGDCVKTSALHGVHDASF